MTRAVGSVIVREKIVYSMVIRRFLCKSCAILPLLIELKSFLFNTLHRKSSFLKQLKQLLAWIFPGVIETMLIEVIFLDLVLLAFGICPGLNRRVEINVKTMNFDSFNDGQHHLSQWLDLLLELLQLLDTFRSTIGNFPLLFLAFVTIFAQI